MTIDRSETQQGGGPFAQAPPRPGPSGRQRTEAGRGARLDAETRRRIGRNLRLLYGDVLNQPLPARFEALLADLSGHAKSGESS